MSGAIKDFVGHPPPWVWNEPWAPCGMSWPQLARSRCWIGRREVRLPPRVTRVLAALLLDHPDRAIPYGELIERIWPDPNLEPASAQCLIDQSLVILRRAGVLVETYWGHGLLIPRKGRR